MTAMKRTVEALVFKRNLGYRDRVMHLVGGGLLAGYALAREGRPLVNDALFILGVLMTMEGLHGYSPVYDYMGWSSNNSQSLIQSEG